jgi:hypothetical protein
MISVESPVHCGTLQLTWNPGDGTTMCLITSVDFEWSPKITSPVSENGIYHPKVSPWGDCLTHSKVTNTRLSDVSSNWNFPEIFARCLKWLSLFKAISVYQIFILPPFEDLENRCIPFSKQMMCQWLTWATTIWVGPEEKTTDKEKTDFFDERYICIAVFF